MGFTARSGCFERPVASDGTGRTRRALGSGAKRIMVPGRRGDAPLIPETMEQWTATYTAQSYDLAFDYHLPDGGPHAPDLVRHRSRWSVFLRLGRQMAAAAV